MRTLKGKQGLVVWHRLMVNKLLRWKSGGDKFNTDERNTESETEDEDIAPLPLETPSNHRGRSQISYSLPPNTGKPPTTSSGILMRRNSETLWTQYIDNQEYRLFVGTWNVAGITPPSNLDLEDWLNTKEKSDIYVIGFQEVVPLKAGNVFGSEDTLPAAKWDALIRKTLNKTPAENGIIRSCSAPPSPFPWTSPLNSQYISSDETTLPPIVGAKSKAVGKSEKINQTEKEPLLNEKYSSSGGRQPYKRVASKQMVGLFITVWIRSELRRHIHDLKVSCVGCGIMGCLGNKGSISVSLSIHQTTFCFICTHLASGQKEGDELRRNTDVSEIMKRTHFPRDSTLDLPETILGHDRIIWFGDLNYRLTLPDTDTRSLIKKEDWETLMESDQLKMEQTAGRIFEGWHERSIEFAPTYKYAANSDQYSGSENKSGEKRRAPAWCDRILWYGKGLKQLSYERGECRLSDHRPVTAIFLADVEVLSNRKIKKTLGLSAKIMEVEDLIIPRDQIEKTSRSPQQEMSVKILAKIKKDSMVTVKEGMLPVLNEVRASQNLELGSILSQELEAWEQENDLKARLPSALQRRVIV
eukprot:Gb_02287 [translate_table: standard]